MMRGLVLAALLALVCPTQAMTEIDEDKASAALGMPGGGKFLLEGVTDACPYIVKVMNKADESDRILFMTDADISYVQHGSCGGRCGMEAVNTMMLACQAETLSICAPFAGLTGGVLYDMSVDPSGADLRDCGL